MDEVGAKGPGGSLLKELKALVQGPGESWFIGIPGGSSEKGSWG